MQTCSGALPCWLDAHPVLVWIFAAFVGAGCLALLGYCIRQTIQHYRDIQAEEQVRQEQRREDRAFVLRAWRTIRMGEEWDVDVSSLRQEVNAFIIHKKVQRVLEHQQTRIGTACVGLLLVLVVGSVIVMYFPQSSALMIGWIVIFALSLLWIGWRYVSYRRLKKRLMTIVDALPFAPGVTNL